MAAFRSWKSYRNFARDVTRHNRYILSNESREFLDTVLSTSDSRARIEVAGIRLWRAQIGCDWKEERDGDETFKVPSPFQLYRMKPLPDRAREGRANPRGISYLYMATDVNTAIAEVRPSVGAYVSVGQFKTVRELRLLDCAVDERQAIRFPYHEPTPETWERIVWEDISDAFYRPVMREDDSADYISTQILAELFKVNGYDGIVYRSSLGPIGNCCLFDINAAELVTCDLYEVSGVTYNILEITNSYRFLPESSLV